MSFRRNLLFAILSGLLIATAWPAHAEHSSCPILREELSHLSRELSQISFREPKSPELIKNEKLERRQKRAIKKARRDSRSLGCFRSSSQSLSGRSKSCGKLIKKISKMETNLKKILRKTSSLQARAKKTGRGAKQQKKREIRARMSRLSCARAPELRSSASLVKKRKRGFFERLFGSTRQKSRYSARSGVDNIILDGGGGVYRTLCVRLCDGYYYPISFATVRGNFETDEAICQASNPHTETRLFAHRNPGETSEDMVDRFGSSYLQLPNAFRYRHEFVGTNICPAGGDPSGLQTIAGHNGDPDILLQPNIALPERFQVASPVTLPSPLVKPDFFIDPDTHMALIGNFRLEPVDQKPKGSLADEITQQDYDPNKIADLGIRIVGPTFLADQEAVKLLQVPDRVQVQ